jgi:hypothetical protein
MRWIVTIAVSSAVVFGTLAWLTPWHPFSIPYNTVLLIFLMFVTLFIVASGLLFAFLGGTVALELFVWCRRRLKS